MSRRTRATPVTAIAGVAWWLLTVLALVTVTIGAPACAADTDVYYHTDALRSVAVVTSATGQIIERTYYAPYGQVLNRPLRDGPGYTGHREDAETRLVYMQQRYYDPESGRFLSVDPVDADADTGANFNRYWYANDNPYRYTDPFGEYTCSGSKTDCTTVANFYNAAVKSMGNMKQDSSEYKATAAAVKYLGKPGVDNGVTVTAKALSGNERGNAAKGGNISIDVAKIKNFGAVLKETGRDSNKSIEEVQNAVGAGVLAHEATHEVDYLNPAIGYPHSEAADRALEVRGYSVEKAVGNALGMDEIGLSTQHEFDAHVQKSVNTFCSDPRNGCQ